MPSWQWWCTSTAMDKCCSPLIDMSLQPLLSYALLARCPQMSSRWMQRPEPHLVKGITISKTKWAFPLQCWCICTARGGLYFSPKCCIILPSKKRRNKMDVNLSIFLGFILWKVGSGNSAASFPSMEDLAPIKWAKEPGVSRKEENKGFHYNQAVDCNI